MEMPCARSAMPRRSASVSSATRSLIPSTTMTARDPAAVARSKFMIFYIQIQPWYHMRASHWL